MDMDISQYKELFISEAQEHLEALNQSMVDLEKDPGNPDVLTEIFRSAHTLKGMSATMGFDQLTELSHEMENVLDGLRSGDIEVSTDIVDLLFGCFDMLGAMVADISEESGKVLDTRPLIEALRAVYAGEKGAITGTEASARPPEKRKPKKKPKSPPAEEREVEAKRSRKRPQTEEEPEEELEPRRQGRPRSRRIAGEKTMRLMVTLDKDCVLKSVRVFMIFKKLVTDGQGYKLTPLR